MLYNYTTAQTDLPVSVAK